jgi:hypothetical protein
MTMNDHDNRDEQRDPAFEILEIDHDTGAVLVSIKMGILGPTANQLKVTTNKRKAASIVRALGHALGKAGDELYHKDEVVVDVD